MTIPFSNKNIILTGLMGSGKTTIGQLLALRLSREFIDTDQLITARFGPASEIFQQPNGEAIFNEIEEEIAAELSTKQSLVIATGGRLCTHPKNVAVLSATGALLCLTAPPEELVTRLINAQGDTYRPRFMKAQNKLQLMETLQQDSESIFSKLEQVPTSGKTPREVVAELTEVLARHEY